MKFWLALVGVPEVEQYVALAQSAEAAGFDGVTVADHLVWPVRIDSKYPYLEDGKVWWPDDLPWPDPWVTLAAMASVTTHLRLATNIYLAALRDPFTAAKAVATAAVLSGERVVCGVSVGWIAEEYQAAGIDFHTRGSRMDELIQVMQGLWQGRPFSHRGAHFDFEEVILQPVPQQPVPIWCGGGSPAALRRASRHDGWMGLPMTPEQLAEKAKELADYRANAGLADAPFEMSFSLLGEPRRDTLARLDDVGASNMMVLPFYPSPWDGSSYLDEGDDPARLDIKQKALYRFAEQVIQPSRER